MKSFTATFISAFVLLLSLTHCQFNNSGRSIEGALLRSAQDTMPDNIGEQDLLDILQGSWVGDTLPYERLEVRNDSVWFFDNRTVVLEGNLIIDSRCGVGLCFDSLLQDNWCFIVENRQGRQCYRVLKCNPDSLYFHAAGSADRTRRFHREE